MNQMISMFLKERVVSLVVFVVSCTFYIWLFQGVIGDYTLKLIVIIAFVFSIAFLMSVQEDPFLKSLEFIYASPFSCFRHRNLLMIVSIVKGILTLTLIYLILLAQHQVLITNVLFTLSLILVSVLFNYNLILIYLIIPVSFRYYILIIMFIIQVAFGVLISASLWYIIPFLGIIFGFNMYKGKQREITEKIIKRSLV